MKNDVKLYRKFPELATDRLLLRRLSNSDEEILFALRTNETVNRYIDRPHHKTIEETRNFIKMINDGINKKTLLYWAICMKERPELIGTICLWNFSEDISTAELGYELYPSYHGEGYMQEALAEVVKYGFFSLGIRKFEAFTHRNNIQSIRLLEKNGFILERERKDKENSNYIIYGLVRQ